MSRSRGIILRYLLHLATKMEQRLERCSGTRSCRTVVFSIARRQLRIDYEPRWFLRGGENVRLPFGRVSMVYGWFGVGVIGVAVGDGGEWCRIFVHVKLSIVS